MIQINILVKYGIIITITSHIYIMIDFINNNKFYFFQNIIFDYFFDSII